MKSKRSFSTWLSAASPEGQVRVWPSGGEEQTPGSALPRPSGDPRSGKDLGMRAGSLHSKNPPYPLPAVGTLTDAPTMPGV